MTDMSFEQLGQLEQLRQRNDDLWNALEAIHEAANGNDTELGRVVRNEIWKLVTAPLKTPNVLDNRPSPASGEGPG